MKSIREIYKIGKGPSSSHTMGPQKASKLYLEYHPNATSFHVTLYGSLAATGKGHLTDVAIEEILGPVGPVHTDWKPKVFSDIHPNMMSIATVAPDGSLKDEWTFYSVGGGSIKCDHLLSNPEGEDVYQLNTMNEILNWCNKYGKTYWEFVHELEDEGIWDYLQEVWKCMKASVINGLEAEGVLPGELHLRRKAASYHIRSKGFGQSSRDRGILFSYCLAVSEENAAGGIVVTAPTCGAAGVLPGILYYLQEKYEFSDTKIIRALATAGLFGNVVKTNASISGAEVGCQGEVGVACAMAAAAANQLMGGSPSQIEYSAEMGLEHHLGMTCDPICGLVQIPCIERNAYAGARALDANIFASYTDGRHRVSFDHVVKVMKQTGNDLPSIYRETSEGGLAIDGSSSLS